MEGALADDDARCDEFLLFAIVGTTVVIGVVAFDLRPVDFSHTILGNGIPNYWFARGCACGISFGNGGSDGGLHVEVAEAFAGTDVWLHAGVGGTVFGLAGWDGGECPRAEGVASILGIAAGDSILDEEREVAPAIDGRGVVLDVGRQIDGQLGVGPGHEIDALAVVEVPGVGAGGGDLAEDVRARDLNEAGVGGDERDRPNGLFGLRGRGAGCPPSEEAIGRWGWGGSILGVETG